MVIIRELPVLVDDDNQNNSHLPQDEDEDDAVRSRNMDFKYGDLGAGHHRSISHTPSEYKLMVMFHFF